MLEYKGYRIEGDGTFGYQYIKPMKQGQVPTKLKGAFTTPLFAKRAVDAYISMKEAEDAAGKTKSAAGKTATASRS